MSTTFTKTVVETFKIVSCYTCSLRFGITNQLYSRVVTDAVGFVYCPACGSKTCWRESEASKQLKVEQKRIQDLEAKLKWEAAEAARQKAKRDEAEASLRATKGQVTKLKRRAAGGVCPCCNRTVQGMAAHMKSKHPEFIQAVTLS